MHCVQSIFSVGTEDQNRNMEPVLAGQENLAWEAKFEADRIWKFKGMDFSGERTSFARIFRA